MLARAGYPADRIHTINHGTPIADSPSPAGDYALYVGRLSPEKGVETLLEAARLVPDIPLVIAGAGPLTPLAEAAASDGVTYLGHVATERAVDLRRRALFTLMPSECYEGQPYGALESMAAGTPLVASRLGGLAEITEDGVSGILVPPGDPRALATAMSELWADKPRAAAMGERAWSYAREQFSPARQIDRLVALYEQLVADAA